MLWDTQETYVGLTERLTERLTVLALLQDLLQDLRETPLPQVALFELLRELDLLRYGHV
jgi:hypothetical protein